MSLLNKASLIQIPSGYKDGTLYSAKPTNGDGDFTFSRGSNLAATRVNSDGLIEKGRENLLLQSNQFDTTWVTGGLTETSGQSGYDGSSNAWLVENVAGGSRYMTQTGFGLGVSTFSIYAKAGTTDWIYLNNGAGVSAYYDLTNGVLGTTSGDIDSKIENIGSGWYRCSITASSVNEVRYYLASGNNSLSTSIGDNVYFQDSQLELGLISTPYIETGASTAQAGILEDMPRLDYSGGATCPSLLLEPQRSNLVTNSEYISSSDYVTGNWTGTITTNTSETLSPEGVYNATKFVKSGSTDRVYFQTSVSDGTYTGSMYFKAVSGQEGNTIEISVRRFGGGSGATTKLITLSSEWQRVDVTATLSGGTNTAIYIADFSSSGNANSFYFYGLQLEAGSYVSSYIPTYGSSSTRSKDSCSKTGISSLIGQTEGTLFADFEIDADNTNNYNRVLAVGDGTSNNRIFIFAQNTEVFRFYVANSGAAQVDIVSSTSILGGRHKVAFAYKANDFIAYVDGVQVGTDTSGTIPSCSNVYVGTHEAGSTQPLEGGINQAILFPTRLSNNELATLTTL